MGSASPSARLRLGPRLVAALVAFSALGSHAGAPAAPAKAGLRGLISESATAVANEHGASSEDHGQGEAETGGGHGGGHGGEAAAEESSGHGEEASEGGGHGGGDGGEAAAEESSGHGEEASEGGGHGGGHGGEDAAEESSGHGEEAPQGGHGEEAADEESSGHGEATSHGSSGGGGLGSGAGGEAHGKSKHGGGGHHAPPISKEERSIAYMMMFAVAAAMVLIFFISYSDPDVRCASSKMACTAISVYCAVLVNQAIFSFIFEQLLVGKDNRGFNMRKKDVKPWMTGLIGAVIFLQMLVGLNFACWRCKDKPNRLMAVSQLGAHMVAWAGINAFGSLQESDGFHSEFIKDVEKVASAVGVGASEIEEHEVMVKYISVVILCFLFFIFIFKLFRYLRMRLLEKFGEHDGDELAGGKHSRSHDDPREDSKEPLVGGASEGDPAEGSAAGAAVKADAAEAGKSKQKLEDRAKSTVSKTQSAKPEEEEEEEEEHWLEELGEGEREASALVLGFLTQQTVVYAITHKVHIPIHGLHDARKTKEVICMAGSAWVTFIFLLWAAVYHQKPGRSSFNFRGYLAMTMAWLFERSGEWFFHIFFENLAQARIWSAFVLTGFAIFATILIDYFADGARTRKSRNEASKSVTLEELIALDRYCDWVEAQKKAVKRGREQQKMPEDFNHIEVKRLEYLNKALRDETPTDISVRTLNVGFSVLIGIVWDMAFESAEAIIVAPGEKAFPISQGLLVDHPVIAKCGLAVFLCAIVLPGWVYYIVPPARKAWRHHLEDIYLERRQVHMQHKGHGLEDENPDD